MRLFLQKLYQNALLSMELVLNGVHIFTALP